MRVKQNNIFIKGKESNLERKTVGFETTRRTAVRHAASKGFIYTLEVLIAIALILVSVVLILRSPPAKPEFDVSTIKAQGFAAMEYLDSKGDLRKLVSEGNETEIENRMGNILSKGILSEVELCGLSCAQTNVPANETVVSINYYVSGYKDSYLGKKVKLWLWRKA